MNKNAKYRLNDVTNKLLMWQYYIECSGANQLYYKIYLNKNINYHI